MEAITMRREKKHINFDTYSPFDISDDDVINAMKEINGYLDITPGDFKELYLHAYSHAIKRISQLFNAEDVMTREVIFVAKNTQTKEIAHMMATRGISGVPVVDNEHKVAGIISEADFLFQMGSKDTLSFMEVIANCLENKGCTALAIKKQKAEDLMTSPAISVQQDMSVTEIASIMKEKNINRVPVVDGDGKLIGIVSRDDIVQTSCALAEKTGTPGY
jgi:CBS-domain-containing membrane protein